MRSTAFPPRRPSALIRYLIPAAVLLSLFYYLRQPAPDGSYSYWGSGSVGLSPGAEYSPQENPTSPDRVHAGSKPGKPKAQNVLTPGKHPIDAMIRAGEAEFAAMMRTQTHSLHAAAKAYRARRGRHPPPGFDAWHAYATARNAVMVEQFWDQIYHDLTPLWGLPAALLRKEAWDFEMTIHIRDGKADSGSDWFWTQIWLKLIKTIEEHLPDMSLPLNAMDEPRIVAAWEDVQKLVAKEREGRTMPPVSKVINKYQKLAKPGEVDKGQETRDKKWEHTEPYWDIARRGCAPDSAARTEPLTTYLETAPHITDKYSHPHTTNGFVSNFTLSQDLCHQADLRGLEGIFIRPLSTSATSVLAPLFGGSKLSTNNEILLPAPMYWNNEVRFTGGEARGAEWEKKEPVAVWRGVATGGRNNATNWRGFQRHRFVAMNNATKLDLASQGEARPENFAMPSEATYPYLSALRADRLGSWIKGKTDVAFTDMFCWEDKEGPDAKDKDGKPIKPHEWVECNYTVPHFSPQKGMEMAEMFNHKLLPDIDGNSFSGRYLGFLRSTSLPVKATLWREWHDSRLVAWKHFVPMDSRFGDWWAIVEYFLGYDGGSSRAESGATGGGSGGELPPVEAHDKEAKKIAMEGSKWAATVLRPEDMQIYVYRLLLEYARVMDDNRDLMGYVGDCNGWLSRSC